MKPLSRSRLLSVVISAWILSPALLLSGCGGNAASDQTGSGESGEPISVSSFQLDTIVTLRIYDSTDASLLDGALAVCDQYEELFSRTIETSDIYRLNHSRTYPVSVSDPTADLIGLGLEYCRITDGAFDLTIAPVAELWDFTSPDPDVPSPEDIREALAYVDWEQIIIEDGEEGSAFISLANPGAGIDLGAIAKGYIADRMKDYLIQNGVKSALIDLGGNILAVGSRPDQSPFVIGIQRPFADRNELCATIEVTDWSVVSSGIYERCFTDPDTGEFYHHILNPDTGYPYQNDLIQVTILSESSAVGDALSTSCYALGLEEGLDLINGLEDVYAIFITKDYRIHYSDGLTERFLVEEITE